MHSLGLAFPRLRERRLFFTRDQWVLFMVAINYSFLSLDTYLVHIADGTLHAREWIPIYFGIIGGVALLVAGLISLLHRNTAALLAMIVFLIGTAVGLIGAYFHLVRGTLPTAPIGSRVTIGLLIYAPPILAPLAFAGVGLVGMGAVWVEDPVGSGRLRVLGRYIQLPYSKSQAYLFYIALGILVAFISSVLDHSRGDWGNYWIWFPAAVAVFAMGVTVVYALMNRPTATDTIVYVLAMLMLVFTGLVGASKHFQADLALNSAIVIERFLKGAPILAPLLFSNMGLFGLIVLLDE